MAQKTKWDEILLKMDLLQNQLNLLRSEVYDLRQIALSEEKQDSEENIPSFISEEADLAYHKFLKEEKENHVIAEPLEEQINSNYTSPNPASFDPQPAFNLEEYIGGNLLSKLGMLILLIGLGIFVKYAIDHNLISPLGRMILSYAAGGVLIALSYYLKANYRAYSAVLMSGGIATIYFTTFIGYVFYGLMPQLPAFLLMFVCTVFAVYQAVVYDEEVIGLIGLVGAYAVPLLLGREGGEVAVMFAYMTLVNAGILSVAFWKEWNRTNLVAFVITWLVFFSWRSLSYESSQITTALLFNLIFFLTFYTTLLVHQVSRQKEFPEMKIALLAANALLFYTLGFSLFPYGNYWDLNTQYTLFDLFNFALHAGVTVYLYRVLPPGDQPIKNLCSGLAVAFLTLAVPTYFYQNNELVTILWFVEVAFLFAFARKQKLIYLEYFSYFIALLSTLSVIPTMEGKWMTLMWLLELTVVFVVGSLFESLFFRRLSYLAVVLGALSIPVHFHTYWAIYLWFGQALLLLGLARWQKSVYMENLSYGVTALMIYGLVHVWQDVYFIGKDSPQLPFFWNISQLHTLLVVLGLGLIAYLVNYLPGNKPDIWDPLYFLKDNPFVVFSGLILLIVYISIFCEIVYYFEYDKLFTTHKFSDQRKAFWLLIYSGVYLVLLLFLSRISLYHAHSTHLTRAFTLLFAFYLLIVLVSLAEGVLLMLNYTSPPVHYIHTRWLLYLVVAGLMGSVLFHVHEKDFPEESYFHALILGINFVVLFGLSLELYVQFVWGTSFGSESRRIAANHALKAGFDLLWGLYSLGLIGYGIYQKRKYLRLAGIFLFGITVAKLFLTDINYNSTLNMILAFVGMGVLLLLTAFLYQKYKDLIFARDEASENEVHTQSKNNIL